MRWLHGAQFNTEEEIKKMVEYNASQKSQGGLKALFGDPTNRKAFFLVLIVLCGFQLSGLIAILYYTASIFGNADVGIDPNLSAVIIGTSYH